MSLVPLIEYPLTKPTTRTSQQRFAFLYLLLTVAATVVISRAFYLQLWRGAGFLAAAENNRVSTIVLPAPRGIIYDHYGQQLVENIASTDVVIDPLLLPPEDQESILVEGLPKYIDIEPTELRDVLLSARQSQRVVVIRKALDHDIVLRLEEALPALPGIKLVSSLVRKYPFSGAIAHVLGYTSAVTAEELTAAENLIPTDITGKAGVEKQYDGLLHGQHGAILREVTADGKPQKELGQQEAIPGANVTLGLDSELQQYIYQLLEDRAHESVAKDKDAPTGAAIIALDPQTGLVRSLVSYPTFDPNVFSQPALHENAAGIFKDARNPLFNRPYDGEYPPGSTIKPFLAAAALEENIITPNTTVLSTGGLTIGPWTFPDWKAGGHGQTNVTKALAESVNTFFYMITGGDETHPGLGVKRATQYLGYFGWGKDTGIDLPTEASGFLPSPEWKLKVKHERWYIGDTYHLGIGQGDVLATPLQVASATATIANGGRLFTPRIVEGIAAPGQKVRPVSTKPTTISVSKQNLQIVREGMRATVTAGSGRSLADLPLAIAGKTGTAQVGGDQPTHAWFSSFAPYDSPQLVVTVLLEKGGAGDRDAIPIARNIWQWWYEHRAASPP